MKRKNLEKSIIMSIVLMGLSNGCLTADAMTSDDFEKKYKNGNAYVVTEDVTVSNEKQTQIGGSDDVKTIQIADGKTLTLGNVSFNYKPTITGVGNGVGNIYITLSGDLDPDLKNKYIFKTGADITANSLTVINSSSDDGKGMAAEDNTIVLKVADIYIWSR